MNPSDQTVIYYKIYLIFLDDTTVTGTGLQDEFDLLRTWGLNEVQFTRAVISKITIWKLFYYEQFLIFENLTPFFRV